MNNKVGLVVVVVIAAAIVVASFQQQKVFAGYGEMNPVSRKQAPIATSGDKNVYVSWPSNKTGNDEVMFKASTDGGKTFVNKMNLSNSPKSESQDVQIAASGNNVYVTWWERNQTMNEPFIRTSNDNGKTFGSVIMLSAAK
jgi:hypothetical protein